jgi:hypothetical protein
MPELMEMPPYSPVEVLHGVTVTDPVPLARKPRLKGKPAPGNRRKRSRHVRTSTGFPAAARLANAFRELLDVETYDSVQKGWTEVFLWLALRGQEQPSASMKWRVSL